MILYVYIIYTLYLYTHHQASKPHGFPCVFYIFPCRCFLADCHCLVDVWLLFLRGTFELVGQEISYRAQKEGTGRSQEMANRCLRIEGPYLFYGFYMCQGLNSHYSHIIGDGHQPNSRGLYTHYKDSY